MVAEKIIDNVFAVGAKDWDRQLFDELIPLPDGTTYNSYLITGSEKTALIDTVDPTKTSELINNLKSIGTKKIDYIIANHAEQDHSGSIATILAKHPEAKVVTNAKCKDMLIDFGLASEKDFIVIADGETLSLGNKTLEFIFAPWVHWPETMFTYLKEDNILFTCDFFGSHFATSDLYAIDEAKVYESAKRYYAEIMMPFRVSIKKHLERVRKIKPAIIAPSHGPVYNKPEFIIAAHEDWASDKAKPEVLIPFVSMHESTRHAVDYLVSALIARNIYVKPFNLTHTDLGALAIALVDAATIVIAAPTVLAGPHPSALYAATIINALRPKTKYLGFINSYSWSSKVSEQLEAIFTNLKAEKIGAVTMKGTMKPADEKLLDALADTIREKHKNLG